MTKHILVGTYSYDNIESQLKDKYDKNQRDRLSFLTACKMIKRFLTCDRIVNIEARYRKYTIHELAEKLSVNTMEVEVFIKKLSSKFLYKRTAGSIALPLIKLYCNTKWAKPK